MGGLIDTISDESHTTLSERTGHSDANILYKNWTGDKQNGYTSLPNDGDKILTTM